MHTPSLIAPDRSCVVQLTSVERRVQLHLRLEEEFMGGTLVRKAPSTTFSVEPADDLAGTYLWTHWASGIASGALYAFRALRIPRQHLVVTDFSGRLRASDMDVVANCAALAISKLAGRELPNLSIEGWEADIQTVTHFAGSVLPGTTPKNSNGIVPIGSPSADPGTVSTPATDS